jgi:hypothetical protein
VVLVCILHLDGADVGPDQLDEHVAQQVRHTVDKIGEQEGVDDHFGHVEQAMHAAVGELHQVPRPALLVPVVFRPRGTLRLRHTLPAWGVHGDLLGADGGQMRQALVQQVREIVDHRIRETTPALCVAEGGNSVTSEQECNNSVTTV